MTNRERNRSSRRVTFVALGISGAVHVAALLLVTLPAPELPAPAERLALMSPLVQPVMLELETVTAPVTAVVAPVADAGGASEGGAAEMAPPRPVPQSPAPDEVVAPRPVAGEQFTLAALDSTTFAALPAQPAAVTAPVVIATAPAGESATEGQSAQPAAPRHIPGSAAKAKGGGKSAGSAGAGESDGFGGITIKIGGGGKKKHPPRGTPGRGRW
jgi:hypothetical protein